MDARNRPRPNRMGPRAIDNSFTMGDSDQARIREIAPIPSKWVRTRTDPIYQSRLKNMGAKYGAQISKRVFDNAEIHLVGAVGGKPTCRKKRADANRQLIAVKWSISIFTRSQIATIKLIT